jgi:site-specific DNA-methyltransferase (adenine-specific)
MIDLRHGDCLEIMPTLAGGSIDMILCDLPYGTTACHWDVIIPFEPLWKEYKRLIRKDGAIVLCGTQPFTSILITSNIKMFKYEWIWEKSKCGSSFTAKYRPQARHENILVFGFGKTIFNPQMVKGEPYKRRACGRKTNNHKLGINIRPEIKNDGTRYPKTIQPFQQNWRRQDQVHPTQKPVSLMEYMVKTYTNEGMTVLDNCMGSGSTGVACQNTNRNFIGIEKEAKYFEIARKRIFSDMFAVTT